MSERAARAVPLLLADIPWRLMAAFRVTFRDKLIHDYFEVDQMLVWATATREIPALLPRLEALCKDIDSSKDS